VRPRPAHPATKVTSLTFARIEELIDQILFDQDRARQEMFKEQLREFGQVSDEYRRAALGQRTKQKRFIPGITARGGLPSTTRVSEPSMT
jgi:hypothetical protein